MKKSVSRIDFFFFPVWLYFFQMLEFVIGEPLFLEIVSTGY